MANLRIPQTALKTTTRIEKEPTGFVDPADMIVSYDNSTRKITLTGTVEGYYRGVRVEELVPSWESAEHSATLADYYLVYDGTSITWVTAGNQKFSDLLIAFVYYHADKFALRECHGFMPNETHEELHFNLGTYKRSGGDLGGFVLSSTTVDDRRPSVSATLLYDEDLPTLNPLLSDAGSPLYTQQYLSSTSTNNFVGLSDIVPLSGNQPYWNEFTGGTWQQTLMSNNHYMSLWLIAVPTSADSLSQEYRYWWVQGQSESLTILEQRALSPSDINLGDIGPLLPEFVFIKQIIIQYVATNWVWKEVINLEGSKVFQTSSQQGGLTSVTTDDSLEGLGTVSSPLKVKIARRTVDPTVNDDDTTGIVTGATWVNTTTNNIFMCADNATGAAVWLHLAHNGQLTDPETDVFTPTLGQTVFTLSQTPVSNEGLMVYLNGQQRLLTTDYTRTGTTLTWQDPVVAGKTVSLKTSDKLVAVYNYGASSGDAVFEESGGIITAKSAGSTLNMETGAFGFTSGATITEFSTDGVMATASATESVTQLAVKTKAEHQYQTESVEAVRNTKQANITGTAGWATVVFNVGIREVGSSYNYSTGEFTFAQNGTYVVTCFLLLDDIADINMTDLECAFDYDTGSVAHRTFYHINPQPLLVSTDEIAFGGSYIITPDSGTKISIGLKVTGGATPTVSVKAGSRFGVVYQGRWTT
jgi:hypothetical protein